METEPPTDQPRPVRPTARLRKKLLASTATYSTLPRPDQSSLEVRAYRDADLHEWLDLQNRVFRAGRRPWTRREFERELASQPHWQPAHLLIATLPRSSSLVGTVYLQGGETVSTASLHWLAVAPHTRRQKVGTGLIDAAERLAYQLGVTQLWAETLSSWETAIGFYRHLGFERVA